MHGIYNHTQIHKQQNLFRLIINNNIDIAILTEWSATLRMYTKTMKHLIDPFKTIKANYKVYYYTTDVCMLVKKTLKHNQVKFKYIITLNNLKKQ